MSSTNPITDDFNNTKKTYIKNNSLVSQCKIQCANSVYIEKHPNLRELRFCDKYFTGKIPKIPILIGNNEEIYICDYCHNLRPQIIPTHSTNKQPDSPPTTQPNSPIEWTDLLNPNNNNSEILPPTREVIILRKQTFKKITFTNYTHYYQITYHLNSKYS